MKPPINPPPRLLAGEGDRAKRGGAGARRCRISFFLDGWSARETHHFRTALKVVFARFVYKELIKLISITLTFSFALSILAVFSNSLHASCAVNEPPLLTQLHMEFPEQCASTIFKYGVR